MKSFLLWCLAFVGLGVYLTQCSEKINQPETEVLPSALVAEAKKSKSKGIFVSEEDSLKPSKLKELSYVYIYRVRRGETLFSIGKKLEIPWGKIAMDNNIQDPRKIHPG